MIEYCVIQSKYAKHVFRSQQASKGFDMQLSPGKACARVNSVESLAT